VGSGEWGVGSGHFEKLKMRTIYGGVFGYFCGKCRAAQNSPPLGFEQHGRRGGVLSRRAVGAHRRLTSLAGVSGFKFSKSVIDRVGWNPGR
jgi:hypothetical protein